MTERRDKVLNMIDYMADRLKERSTWLGIIGVATSFGVKLPHVDTETAISIGSAAAGLIAALIPDKKA